MIDRRRFLVLAAAAVTAPAAIWLGADVLSAGGVGTAPPDEPPEGPSTAELLARTGANLVVPTGVFRTRYADDAPDDDTTWDLRRSRRRSRGSG
jgi:hypothetical protein